MGNYCSLHNTVTEILKHATCNPSLFGFDYVLQGVCESYGCSLLLGNKVHQYLPLIDESHLRLVYSASHTPGPTACV